MYFISLKSVVLLAVCSILSAQLATCATNSTLQEGSYSVRTSTPKPNWLARVKGNWNSFIDTIKLPNRTKTTRPTTTTPTPTTWSSTELPTEHPFSSTSKPSVQLNIDGNVYEMHFYIVTAALIFLATIFACVVFYFACVCWRAYRNRNATIPIARSKSINKSVNNVGRTDELLHGDDWTVHFHDEDDKGSFY